MKCPSIVCCTGLKGKKFLEKVTPELEVEKVISYPQTGEDLSEYEAIQSFAKMNNLDFEESKKPDLSFVSENHLVFFVGWQWLVHEDIKNLIVFHDSLLPRYRGFAPTVTALINHEKVIGVSAIQPTDAMDAGPVYGQTSWSVEYPIKLSVALEKQANAMGDLAIKLGKEKTQGPLSLTPQDESNATYSIWRKPEDGIIDWNNSAEYICRLIDSVGFPYTGAISTYDGKEIIIDDASVHPDVHFEIRQAGKIFQLIDSKPLVICGKGMVLIEQARYRSSLKPVHFKKIKLTMGK